MPPQLPVAGGRIDMTETFSSRRFLATSTSQNLRFFGPQFTAGATGEYTELTSDGYLPDAKSGMISGLFHWNSSAVNAGTVAQTILVQKTYLELVNLARLQLRVGTVLVSQHPMKLIGSNPEWLQGVWSTGNEISSAQGGGIHFAFGEHPVGMNTPVAVDCVSIAAGAATPAGSSATLGTWVTVAIQVKTMATFVAQGGV